MPSPVLEEQVYPPSPEAAVNIAEMMQSSPATLLDNEPTPGAGVNIDQVFEAINNVERRESNSGPTMVQQVVNEDHTYGKPPACELLQEDAHSQQNVQAEEPRSPLQEVPGTEVRPMECTPMWCDSPQTSPEHQPMPMPIPLSLDDLEMEHFREY